MPHTINIHSSLPPHTVEGSLEMAHDESDDALSDSTECDGIVTDTPEGLGTELDTADESAENERKQRIPLWFKVMFHEQFKEVVTCCNHNVCGYGFVFQGSAYSESFNAEFNSIIIRGV